ncbi:predicted protein [Aspergillus terreus NIH2624]|uniref:Uncharacterized protein n=1 Tax=Aspergillus terreus (strain NIH 2624 / FGSC A1156) TaxID=341663 RepID=Q0CSW8_ASPTN|nr:uncharacterized protein ATEG_03216 [Aspergillus terreus NIH2624]EAU36490.1 predicted protein [Aspergillus terreus NIH2624]
MAAIVRDEGHSRESRTTSIYSYLMAPSIRDRRRFRVENAVLVPWKKKAQSDGPPHWPENPTTKTLGPCDVSGTTIAPGPLAILGGWYRGTNVSVSLVLQI